VLATHHSLARRDAVNLVELADDPFISFRAGSRLRELLDGAAAASGFEPRIALESNESRRIRSLVSSGLGVAILPRSDAVGGGAPVVVVRLVEPALTRDVTLASRARRHHSPAAQAFLALTVRVFDPPPQPAIIES
jgi:DNA-binding transcriptional LysR family regulator